MNAGASRFASPLPLVPLLALTAAVVLAHVLVLEMTPAQFSASTPLASKAFTTRSLQIERPVLPLVAPAPSPTARQRAAVTPLTSAAAAATPGKPPEPPATVTPVQPPKPEPAPEPVAQANVPDPAASAAQATATATPAPQPAANALERDNALVARNYLVPGSVRLKFNAVGQRAKLDYTALGEMLWLHDGKDYEARMELSVLFSKRSLTSTGRLTGDGLAPSRFSDRFRSEQAAHFERDKGRVTFSANTPESPLLPGAQDQLSVFVQLASMLAGDPPKFPAGTSIAVQTIGPRSAEPWVFVVETDELIDLPGGQQATRKLVRSPRKDFDQKVEIWLAPALSWLPARIRITQPNGDFIDQQWRSTSNP